ncbi:MAG: glycoside hydrolase family 36 N-terminal domain-containing protein, partial [Turicibacter sp.]
MTITIDNERKVFGLHTTNTSYVFGVDDQGLLRHLHWGALAPSLSDFEMPVLTEVSTNDPVFEITPEEYPVYGSLRYKEHCLKVKFADLTRELVYKYVGFSEDNNELVIHLEDSHYAFEIDLHYKVYPEHDLIERFVSIKNKSEDVIEVDQIQSAQFHIPYQQLNFSNTHGHWGNELQRFTQKVNYGKIKIENRRGISTHNHNPFFILDKDATE